MNKEFILLMVVFGLIFSQIPMVLAEKPQIIDVYPESPVGDEKGMERSFNLKFDQDMNVKWFYKGEEVKNDLDTDFSFLIITSELGEWQVSAVAENENGTVSYIWEWWVVDSLTCGIDVYELDVVDGKIMFPLENTGNIPETISYSVHVNDKPAFDGNAVVYPEGKEEIKNSFSFTEEENDIRVQASASCGASDKEEMVHIIFEEYVCKSPAGKVGHNYCDYSSQEYLVCEGNGWKVLGKNDNDYCFNCADTCGDGVCNCEETINSCYSDCYCPKGYTNQFTCQGDWQMVKFQQEDCSAKWVKNKYCAYGCEDNYCKTPCPEGYLNEYDCSGSTLWRRYLTNTCEEIWKFVEACPNGCYENACLGSDGPKGEECGIDIQSVDYVDNFHEGEKGRVVVTVKNTGTVKEKLNLTLLVDGAKKYSYSINMNSGDEIEKAMFYYIGPGLRNGDVIAKTSCGSVDSASFQVNVLEKEEEVIFPPYTPPYEEEEIETLVTISPDSLDIFQGMAKSIAVDIQSERQPFSISVSGVPPEWVSYDNLVEVQGSETIFIFVTPKVTGNYVMEVSVTALDENKFFSSNVDLFVITPGQAPLSEAMGSDVIFYFVIGMVIIIVAGAGIGIYYRRSDGREWNYLYKKYGLFNRKSAKKNLF
jgi:hypothetical protein